MTHWTSSGAPSPGTARSFLASCLSNFGSCGGNTDVSSAIVDHGDAG